MAAQQYGFNWDATWLEQTVTPATPDAGKRKIFPKSDGFYDLDSTGTARKFATSGGGITYGLTSTATAGGTTTLTSASNPIQLFTGVLIQNCVLPAATTLMVGWWFTIRNTSTGIVTVKDGGAGATIVALAANQEVTLYCTSIGSAAGTWSQQIVSGTGAYALTTSPTFVTPTLGVAAATSIATSGHAAVNTTLSTTSALSVVETVADPAAQVQAGAFTETATLSTNSSLTPIVQAATFAAVLNIGSSNATGAAPGGIRAFNTTATVTGTSGTATFANVFRAQLLISGGVTLTGGATILIATPTNSSSTMTSVAGIMWAAQTTASNNTYALFGTTTIPTGNFVIYSPISTPSSHLGNFGIGLAANVTPTNALSLTGQSAQTIWMERQTTAATAGNSLTVQSGGAVSGGTDKAGGALILTTGLGTGNSVPGLVRIQGDAAAATTGTGNQSQVDRHIPNAYKVLTNNSAITIVNATLAAAGLIGGVIRYTIEVFDGTDLQVETGAAYFSGYNKAGAFSCTITEVNSQQNASSGTLATTWAISGANPAAISINANSSLTPSTGYPRITYELVNFSQQAVAIA